MSRCYMSPSNLPTVSSNSFIFYTCNHSRRYYGHIIAEETHYDPNAQRLTLRILRENLRPGSQSCMTFLGKARSKQWLSASGVNARSVPCTSLSPHGCRSLTSSSPCDLRRGLYMANRMLENVIPGRRLLSLSILTSNNSTWKLLIIT